MVMANHAFHWQSSLDSKIGMFLLTLRNIVEVPHKRPSSSKFDR